MITDKLDPKKTYRDAKGDPLEYGKIYTVNTVYGMRVTAEVVKNMSVNAIWTGHVLIDDTHVTWNHLVDPNLGVSPAVYPTVFSEESYADAINNAYKKANKVSKKPILLQKEMLETFPTNAP